MSTINQVAAAFLAGTPAKCGNAKTDGKAYLLHGHTIAIRGDDGNAPGNVTAFWCGYYTPTTANHLNHIAKALGAKRVSYATARNAGVSSFFFEAA